MIDIGGHKSLTLQDHACKSALAVDIENIRDPSNAHQSLESAIDWDTFKGKMIEAACLTIGFHPRNGGN